MHSKGNEWTSPSSNKSNKNSLRKHTQYMSELTQIPTYIIEHVLKLYYLSILHDMSNTVIDADHKLSSGTIEIPYIGKVYLEFDKNSCSALKKSDIKCEWRLINDIRNILENGESPLIQEAEKVATSTLLNMYKKLL